MHFRDKVIVGRYQKTIDMQSNGTKFDGLKWPWPGFQGRRVFRNQICQKRYTTEP